MVKIRLKRMGMKKHPFYRIVVADERSPVMAASLRRLATMIPCSIPLLSRLITTRPLIG